MKNKPGLTRIGAISKAKISKIAKRFQSAKVFVNWGPLDEFFLEKRQGRTLGFFSIHSVVKLQNKLKVGPFADIFATEKNVLQCRKNSKVQFCARL